MSQNSEALCNDLTFTQMPAKSRIAAPTGELSGGDLNLEFSPIAFVAQSQLSGSSQSAGSRRWRVE